MRFRYHIGMSMLLLVWIFKNAAAATAPELRIRDVYEGIMNKLDSLSQVDECTRDVVIIAKESCHSRIPPDTRVELAVQLTLCELQYSKVDTPCPLGLPLLECAKLLHKRAQWWTSFSGYFQSIDSLCRGLTTDYENQRVLETYRNVTALHGHLYTQLSDALQRSCQDIDRVDTDRLAIVAGMRASFTDLQSQLSLLSDSLVDKAHLADSLTAMLSQTAIEAGTVNKKFKDSTESLYVQQEAVSKKLNAWSVNLFEKLANREHTFDTRGQAAIKNFSEFIENALEKTVYNLQGYQSEILNRQQGLVHFLESTIGTATHLEMLLQTMLLSMETRSEEMNRLYSPLTVRDTLHTQQDIMTLSRDAAQQLENIIAKLNKLTHLTNKLARIGKILISAVWYPLSCFGLIMLISPRARSLFVLILGVYVICHIFPVSPQPLIFLPLICAFVILITRPYIPIYFVRKSDCDPHTHLLIDSGIYDSMGPIVIPVCLERQLK